MCTVFPLMWVNQQEVWYVVWMYRESCTPEEVGQDAVRTCLSDSVVFSFVPSLLCASSEGLYSAQCCMLIGEDRLFSSVGRFAAKHPFKTTWWETVALQKYCSTKSALLLFIHGRDLYQDSSWKKTTISLVEGGLAFFCSCSCSRSRFCSRNNNSSNKVITEMK